MDVLFLHPNFPGQFRHLAPALARQPGCRVWALGDASKPGPAETLPGVTVLTYPAVPAAPDAVHPWVRGFDQAVRRGEAVLQALVQHKRQGLEPDVIVAHPGWGDAYFVRDFFPGARVIGFFEYYYRYRGADVGFDPEFRSQMSDAFRLQVTNATQLLALQSCDVGVCPTAWQRSVFPRQYQDQLVVQHEGIDTTRLKPDAQASVTLPDGTVLRAGDEVLTYVSRHLEPYRGFHIFMRALPQILRERPHCRVLVLGDEGQSYGPPPTEGGSWKARGIAHAREDLQRDGLDLSRVHFLGKLSYNDYVRVLQVSRAHVYLTYPFVLSWSMLEAMACGATLVASATPPVREFVDDDVHGRLFPFFDTQALARSAVAALADPAAHAHLGVAARQRVIERADFATVSLPAWVNLLDH